MKRALLWGLAYILVWEGFVARSGRMASRFAIRANARSFLTRVSGGPHRLISSPSLGASTRFGWVTLNHGRAVVALAALGAIGALWLAVTRTRWGRAIRATGLDRDAAALVGINVYAATRITLVLAMALSGAAGVLLATTHYVYPTAGVELTLLAIMLTIWAEVGRLLTVLVAGLLLGIAESLTVAISGPAWREPVIACLLLASLLARPPVD